MKLRLLVLATIATINVFAQSYYGGLGGTVLDQNGGALSGAKVTLINEGTNAQRSVISASAGEFVFTELVPGTYGLTVEAPGFKKFEQKGVLVGTQQQVSVDAKMQIGQVSESIEVSGVGRAGGYLQCIAGPGNRQSEADGTAESRPQSFHVVETGAERSSSGKPSL